MMTKPMIDFPYVTGQYKDVTGHLFTRAAMRRGQEKNPSDLDTVCQRVVEPVCLEGLWNSLPGTFKAQLVTATAILCVWTSNSVLCLGPKPGSERIILSGPKLSCKRNSVFSCASCMYCGTIWGISASVAPKSKRNMTSMKTEVTKISEGVLCLPSHH